MLKIDKIITKFLFILSVSFFIASNVFAGGAISETIPSTNNVEVNIEKNDINVEIPNSSLSSPTILTPKNDDIISYNETITGAISSGATARIYIDGVLDGEIKSWESKTGISAFFYKPKQNLSEGIHFIKAQTVKNGFVSDFSKEVMIIKEAAYEAPVVRLPYYYKDDYKTFVVRGIANSKDTIDIYLDGKKIKTLNLPESKREDGKVNFLYAIHNLSDGKHSGYFVAYQNATLKRSYNSKEFYFNVENPTPTDTNNITTPIEEPSEVENKEETKQEPIEPVKVDAEDNTKQEQKVVDNTKKDTENNNINKQDSNNITQDNKKVEDKSSPDYEKNKSMTIGIVLLVCSIILMLFWIYSENQDRIKKFIDRLLDEDYEDDKDKDNKNKK